jgi:LEA14-like dessication related protein
MKNVLPTPLLPVLFLSLLLSSCREPKDLVYRDFKNLRVEKMGFSSSLIKLDLIFYNPNNFGLQLKNTDLDISIDSNTLGHTFQEYQVTIPKRAEFTLPIQLELDMKNVFRNSLTTLLGKEVLVRATGTLKLGKANIFKTYKVNYEGRQKFSLL